MAAHVVNGHSFERWRKQAEQKDSQLLYLSRDYLMEREAGHEKSGQFPDTLQTQGLILPLRYHFDPKAADDGVTVRIPLLGMNQLPPPRFEYLVPGMLEEKITTLIRSLPKQVRKQFVPAPDYAPPAWKPSSPVKPSRYKRQSVTVVAYDRQPHPHRSLGRGELAPHLLDALSGG